jgi:hypothetical protein
LQSPDPRRNAPAATECDRELRACVVRTGHARESRAAPREAIPLQRKGDKPRDPVML